MRLNNPVRAILCSGLPELERDAFTPRRLDQQYDVRAVHSQSRPQGPLRDPDFRSQRGRRGTAIPSTHRRLVTSFAFVCQRRRKTPPRKRDLILPQCTECPRKPHTF